MCWGHATSTDLLAWEHHAPALVPDPDGPDSFGCWSGSVVVDDETGIATIHYTGVVLRDGTRVASIRRAVSHDGLATWTKDPEPVIDGAPAGIAPDLFRDPHVTRADDGWLMVVGAGQLTGSGCVLGWRSDDGRTWRAIGPVLTVEDVVAALPGCVTDVDSPCWECPQLVRMGDRDVLIVSILERAPNVRPSHVMAFTGRLEGDRFAVERAERLGLGPDFYAPAVARAPDGRHLLLGWIPEDPPGPRSSRSWAGALTLPRVVTLDPSSGVRIAIAGELARVIERVVPLSDALVTPESSWTWRSWGPCFELDVTLAPAGAALVRLEVGAPGGDLVEIRYEPGERRLTVIRSGRVRFAGISSHGTTVLDPPGGATDAADAPIRLRVIVDGSVLEMVAAETITATARLPGARDEGRIVRCTTVGGACELRAVSVASFPDPSAG